MGLHQVGCQELASKLDTKKVEVRIDLEQGGSRRLKTGASSKMAQNASLT